ncbi:hypothetical protein PHET_11894 [Paragonimus heterotremus]|uniref:Uncharacterized protein n=1 Tax=Paragonimus heterotremus TaxID=100268 RepID=A0A8J4WT55_9TREM|nr:hypothetical protein PHET_11894 [Paragonimus heterotremus]
MPKNLSGYVCVVTGATRGLGKAIAVALGETGATVYITGRTLDPPGQSLGKDSECLRETARLIESLGGDVSCPNLLSTVKAQGVAFFLFGNYYIRTKPFKLR